MIDTATTFFFWCFWMALGVIAYAQRPGARFEMALIGALLLSGIALSLVGLPVTADGGIGFIVIVVAAEAAGAVIGRILRTRIVLRAGAAVEKPATDPAPNA